MGYSRDTIKGVSWVGGVRMSMRIFTLVRTGVLARLLTPAQFGTFGIAVLVLGLIEMITETGINTVLVQEKKEIDRYVDTAWVISIIRGILIAAVIIATAPFVSGFFGSQEAAGLLYLTSLVPFIRGFINPSLVKLQRNLAFDKEFWLRTSIFFVESFVSIILAFVTKSPASIIWGLIASACVEVLLSFLFLAPRPRLAVEGEKVRHIIGRGKWMTAASLFNYLFYNGDNIIVGRILGAAPLGLYQMGYRIATVPVTEVSDVVSRVTFPVYTKIADDRKRLSKAFVKTLLTVFAVTVAFGMLLLFFPQPVVQLLLGQQWLAVTPVLQILAVFGVIRAVSSSVFSLFLAVGKQEFVSLVTLVGFAGLAIAIVPLVLTHGIIGAAIAALIASLVPLPVMTFLAVRVLRNKEGKA